MLLQAPAGKRKRAAEVVKWIRLKTHQLVNTLGIGRVPGNEAGGGRGGDPKTPSKIPPR